MAYSTNNSKEQSRIAKELQESGKAKRALTKVKCLGCKDTSSSVWKSNCKVRPCCEDWGHEFCYQCTKYSCDLVEDVFKEFPDARGNLKAISNVGGDAWVAQKSAEKRKN